MTNEKAIKMLEYIRRTGNGESEYKNDAQAIAIDMAIKALEQELCENCISRQEAINCVTSNEFRYKIVEDIKTLPSTTLKEKTGWIPVSERLPETNDDVLVTDGVDMFVAWYSGMWQGWMSSDNNFERNTPIEAWMPLPEPYKEVDK